MSPTVLSLYYLLHGSQMVLPGLATSQVLMDVLHVEPAEMSLVLSLLWLPWAFKPIFGYLSDHFPIFGYRRLPYLMLGITLNAVSWFVIYGLLPELHHANRWIFYVVLFACYGGMVLAETVVDALLAEQARGEKADDSGKVQSGAWTLDAAGTLLSTLAVTCAFGQASDNQQSTTTRASASIFLACGCLVVLSACLLPFLQEVPSANSEPLARSAFNHSVSAESRDPENLQSTRDATQAKPALPRKEEDSTVTNNEQVQPSVTEAPSQQQQPIPTLSDAFSDPRLVRCLIFCFVVSSSPTSGDAFFYFQRDRLNFSLEFLAWMGVARTLLNGAASCGYYLWWRKLEYRTVFLSGILLSFFVGIINVLVVERWNVALGIPDHAFILGDTVVQGIAGEIIFLPVAVLAAKLAPPGLEGTVYATTMSVVNVSWMISSLLSGFLSSLLDVRVGHYENLTALIVLVNALTLLPLSFLHLVPSMTTANTAGDEVPLLSETVGREGEAH